jgi:hypothetical protein
MTVRQLLANLDAAELTEWLAFNQIEPIGEPRADLRAGIIASAVANYGPRDLPTPAQPSVFMPFLERHDEPERPVLLNDADEQSALIFREVFLHTG